MQLDMVNPVSVKKNSKSLDFTVTVLKPLQLHEYIANFVNQWFTPLTGIYQTVASIIGGISGYLIGSSKTYKEKQQVERPPDTLEFLRQLS